MPPLKPVKSLLKLSLNVASNSLYSACKKMKATYPWADDFSDVLSAPGCRDTIQELQDYLRVFLPPMVWDSFYQAVMDLQREGKSFIPKSAEELIEEIFVLAIFIYDQVFLKELRVSEKCLFHSRLGPFLLEQAPKLGNLVAVDIKIMGVNFDFEEILTAFGRSCKHLKILILNSHMPDKTKNIINRACGQSQELEMFNFDCVPKESLELLKNLEHLNGGHVESWLQQFDKSHRFKLQSLRLVQPSLQQLEITLEQCPHLKELHLSSNNESCDQVLQILAASFAPLKILTLHCCAFEFASLHGFMSSKGISLKELNLRDCRLDRPLETLQMIGQTCPNLTTLRVFKIRPSDEHPDSPETKMSFQNLQHLDIHNDWFNCSRKRTTMMTFANQAIASAINLKTVNLPYYESRAQYGDWLIDLLASNQGVRSWEKVTLTLCCVDISKEIVELLYEMCPELTYLKIRHPSPEALTYLEQLKEEAIIKNLDFLYEE